MKDFKIFILFLFSILLININAKIKRIEKPVELSTLKKFYESEATNRKFPKLSEEILIKKDRKFYALILYRKKTFRFLEFENNSDITSIKESSILDPDWASTNFYYKKIVN